MKTQLILFFVNYTLLAILTMIAWKRTFLTEKINRLQELQIDRFNRIIEFTKDTLAQCYKLARLHESKANILERLKQRNRKQIQLLYKKVEYRDRILKKHGIKIQKKSWKKRKKG